MPRDDNEKQKRSPGRPRRRTFYNRFSFHVSEDIHRQMKIIAKSRNVFLEEIYREAIQSFLDMRASISSQQYSRAPMQSSAKSVTIPMEDHLCQTIRHAAIDLRCNLADVIETAVRLYLDKNPRD